MIMADKYVIWQHLTELAADQKDEGITPIDVTEELIEAIADSIEEELGEKAYEWAWMHIQRQIDANVHH